MVVSEFAVKVEWNYKAIVFHVGTALLSAHSMSEAWETGDDGGSKTRRTSPSHPLKSVNFKKVAAASFITLRVQYDFYLVCVICD